jgi:RNA polymerase sigma-70 factor (ECF subfamily)
VAETGDAQQLLVLHKRLLEGDRVASEELAGLVLERLVSDLGRKFPHTDSHVICDGVTDAVLDYCARPVSFDSSRGVPLDRFLAKAAWRNIANLLRSERRRKAREDKSVEYFEQKVVELQPSAGNPLQNEALAQQDQVAELMQTLENPVDKKVFELRMLGERRTEEFARVMGISHLPLVEQRSEVKRAKDRIEKLLKRHKASRP